MDHNVSDELDIDVIMKELQSQSIQLREKIEKMKKMKNISVGVGGGMLAAMDIVSKLLEFKENKEILNSNGDIVIAESVLSFSKMINSIRLGLDSDDVDNDDKKDNKKDNDDDKKENGDDDNNELGVVPVMNKSAAVAVAAVTAGVAVAELIGKGLGFVINAASTKSAKMTGQIVNDVNSMKNEYGSGISSLVTIYNKTAARLIYKSDSHSHGHIWKYPYPSLIMAGGNGCFLHVHSSSAWTGSQGSVVYSIQYFNKKQKGFKKSGQDVTFSWDTPYVGTNDASCSISGKSSFNYAVTSTAGQSSSPVYDFSLTETV